MAVQRITKLEKFDMINNLMFNLISLHEGDISYDMKDQIMNRIKELIQEADDILKQTK